MKSIAEAVKLKSELDKLRPLTIEDEQRIMQKFRLDWNYHSNHLEGNTLTHGETKALILFGITAQGKPLKDHFEIKGHNEAIELVVGVVSGERRITENFIREIHTLILKESYEVDAITPEGEPTKKKVNVGVYKSSPNHVRTKTGEIFRFATPEETPAKMHDLISWYNEQLNLEDADANHIRLAALFHYKFISIHPFDDGNGRTARILMNFILMKSGYPPAIIRTEDKEKYFSVLRLADAGNLEPFVDFIGENLIYSLDLMIRGARGESVEDKDDIEKEIALLDLKIQQVGDLSSHRMSDIDLKDFLERSILKLINEFQRKCKLFDKYYFETQLDSTIDGKTYALNADNVMHMLLELVNENTELIELRYKHEGCILVGFQDLEYSSVIGIRFNDLEYHVFSLDVFREGKFYTDVLSDDEISGVINPILKDHKNMIEKSIAKVQKEK